MDATLLTELLYVTAFEPDHQTLYARLASEVVWDERIRARKTASFGVPYDYSGLTYDATPMPETIARVRDRVAARVGWVANNCLLNLYPDGRSTMGFHADETDHLEPNTGIAVVSLGGGRTLRFRATADKTRVADLWVEGGSLLHMTLAMQNGWRHGVFAESAAAGRISLTFRSVASQPAGLMATTSLHPRIASVPHLEPVAGGFLCLTHRPRLSAAEPQPRRNEGGRWAARPRSRKP